MYRQERERSAGRACISCAGTFTTIHLFTQRGGYDINGLILVEREGQKKMVIGNKGAKIKTIGIEARKDMQDMFEAPVHLELWVKVKSGWADDERALRSLGYGDDL